MSTTALVPVEEYLRQTDKLYREYRGEVLTPKAIPAKFHSLIQFALLMLLRAQGLQALPELTVRISPTKYLVPDVCVTGDFAGLSPTEPALLCCEILSRDDRLGAMLSQCEEYHGRGVPYCWVVDPVNRIAWEYHAGSDPSRADGNLRAGEYSVDLKGLFSALDAASR